MTHFDINKYKTPDLDQIDMKMTKTNFEIFMSAYGAAREKVGENRMPKMTQSFDPTPSTPHREYSGDAERFMIEREEYMPEYKELHQLFGNAYLSICNYSREGATERRRQLFMLRYVYGLSIQRITERIYLGKTAIVEESKKGFIQFCDTIGLLVDKEETAPLVPTEEK